MKMKVNWNIIFFWNPAVILFETHDWERILSFSNNSKKGYETMECVNERSDKASLWG